MVKWIIISSFRSRNWCKYWYVKTNWCPGLAIALFGSILPFLMDTSLSYLYGNSLTTSIAVGTSFKILNTQTSQLIIAAAILDDVVVLILLLELNAMKNPTVLGIYISNCKKNWMG